MSKHSPAPWSARGSTAYDANERPIPIDGGYQDLAWDGDPEAEANARLIAAAPKMLEALKQIAGALEDWSSIPPPRDNTGEERALVVAAALARAVAALAEGKEA
jgi:hypothetical protein